MNQRCRQRLELRRRSFWRVVKTVKRVRSPVVQSKTKGRVTKTKTRTHNQMNRVQTQRMSADIKLMRANAESLFAQIQTVPPKKTSDVALLQTVQSANEEALSGQQVSCNVCGRLVDVKKGGAVNLGVSSVYREERPTEDDVRIAYLYCPGGHRRNNPFALHANGVWHYMEEVLRVSDGRSGIFPVETEGDWVVLFVLNRIVHRRWDKDGCPLLTHHSHDNVRLFWVDGEAVGFYSVREKARGAQRSRAAYERPAIPILDTIFVREQHRRKGYATRMLQEFLDTHPKGKVGLSIPLQREMAVCGKRLLATMRQQVRDRLVVVGEDGKDGMILWDNWDERGVCVAESD